MERCGASGSSMTFQCKGVAERLHWPFVEFGPSLALKPQNSSSINHPIKIEDSSMANVVSIKSTKSITEVSFLPNQMTAAHD